LAKAVHCSVIIPAFNEEAVISRCLSNLLDGAPSDHGMEIIVAANGCHDATVEIAKAVAPQSRILDLAKGTKTGAINAANAIASRFPRIYLDADVECSYSTIMALCNAFEESEVMTAAPAIRLNLDRASWLIRAYFRVWQKQPYARSGNGGAGCYALSCAASEHVGDFPDIIGDDIWIHTRFPEDQKRYVSSDGEGSPVFTVVYPPRTALEQIRVEARRQIGNAEVLRLHPGPHDLRSGGAGAVRTAFQSGSSPLDIATFFSMKFCARLLAKWNRSRGRGSVWSRDHSSRQV